MTRTEVAAGRLARAWRALLRFGCRLGDTGAAGIESAACDCRPEKEWLIVSGSSDSPAAARSRRREMKRTTQPRKRVIPSSCVCSSLLYEIKTDTLLINHSNKGAGTHAVIYSTSRAGGGHGQNEARSSSCLYMYPVRYISRMSYE